MQNVCTRKTTLKAAESFQPVDKCNQFWNRDATKVFPFKTVRQLHCNCNCCLDPNAIQVPPIERQTLYADGGDGGKTYLESDDFDLPRRLVILIRLESDEVNGHLARCHDQSFVQKITSVFV